MTSVERRFEANIGGMEISMRVQGGVTIETLANVGGNFIKVDANRDRMSDFRGDVETWISGNMDRIARDVQAPVLANLRVSDGMVFLFGVHEPMTKAERDSMLAAKLIEILVEGS